MGIVGLEDYRTKQSVVVVYTGEGKGKTSAAVGLMARALGNGWRVAFIQFIKHWDVSEHDFIKKIQQLLGDQLLFYKGGKGFYNAGSLSAKDVTLAQHKKAAKETYEVALQAVSSGKFGLVVCDEINNAVFEGLLPKKSIKDLIEKRSPKTSLCLTGRNFPKDLLESVDIATSMTKLRHHFDNKYLANKGIDF
ncbi:MAG TPA: cob(I)yrinic acid a,c-diamide adenosyltransferase [Candidatus Saccharimonadales bacterium]